MPRTVTATDVDTLCGIAIRSGFLNCDLLRAEDANKDFLTRRLKAGDKVTVPDLRDNPKDSPATKNHKFKIKRRPEPQIRFVHGTPDKPFDQDPTLTVLNISNYRTNKAGPAAAAAFSNAFGFNADAHADPDTFKVEVVSPDGGGSITVKVEALKPVYAADGSVSKHELFTGADYNARKLDAESKPVTGSTKRFRSRYLRLVSDDQDQAAAATQTLLVTDTADGNDGDADKVEILDQKVRASYTLPKCNAAAPNKCTVVAELDVGESERRIRVAVHCYRATVGGAAVAGLTEQMLRRRLRKWFRRAYAPANMSVKMVGPKIEFIDPPAPNMITISQDTGVSAAGVDAAGHPSTLTFRLAGPPVPVIDPLVRLFDPTVTVNLAANMTPAQVGAAIVAALPGGYSGQAFTNARAFNAADASCDVLITRDNGKRVLIRGEATTDTRLPIAVARVNLAAVDANDANGAIIPSTIDMRRVLRGAAGADDRLDFYFIDTFLNNGLRGRAYVPGTDLAAAFQPPQQLRWAVVMAANSGSGPVLDGSDNLPFTFPHEAGHVLNDAFHSDNNDPNGPTELMSGAGTSVANGVNATKRISDAPVTVRYAMFDPAQPTPGAAIFSAITAAPRMRTRGNPVTEGW